MNSRDIFISYSRADNQEKPRVSELVEHIQKEFLDFAGRPLNPFFDKHAIQPGENWRHDIQQGLKESYLFLAFLSPNYFKSDYCRWEMIEYQKQEIHRPVGREGIMPIYFIPIPGFGGKDFEHATAEWFQDLRRRDRVELFPWASEGGAALKRKDVQDSLTALTRKIRVQVELGDLIKNARGNIGRFDPYFTGRAKELAELRNSVVNSVLGVVTAVHGLGGIGKTALAYAYANAFLKCYPAGRWQLLCADETDLRLVFNKLASQVDFAVEFTEPEKIDQNLKFARILQELKKKADAAKPVEPNINSRILIILDNVDQKELLSRDQLQHFPAGDWLHIIATTRFPESEFGYQSAGELQGIQAQPGFVVVEEMREEDAVDLIEKYQPRGKFAQPEDKHAAHELARFLGGYALAVEYAAVYLGLYDNHRVTIARFLEHLRNQGLGGLDEAVRNANISVQHGADLLHATLDSTLTQLRLSPPEQLVLAYASLLPADYIVWSWLRELAGREFPDLLQDAKSGEPDPWNLLQRRLLSLRLLLPNERHYVRMHRIVQEVARQRLGEQVLQLEENLISCVRDRTYASNSNIPRAENRWELDPIAACVSHWMETARWSKEGAHIAHEVVTLLQKLARFEEAEPLCRRGLSIVEETLGQNHFFVAYSLNSLALLLQDTGRPEEAEHLLRRAASISESHLGPDHPDVSHTLYNLAGLLTDSNHRDEAELLYLRVLAIRENQPSPDHLDIAEGLNGLGTLLSQTNRKFEAEPLFQRAADIYDKHLGPENLQLTYPLNNLAVLLCVTNRENEAEPLYRRILSIREKQLGPNHPDFAQALNNFASLLRDTNRREEAAPLFQRALLILENSLGGEHSLVAKCLDDFAVLLSGTNRKEEAEPMLCRSLAIYVRNLGANHPLVATALNGLGNLLRDSNRSDEAESYFRRALSIREEQPNCDEGDIAQSLTNLAIVLSDTNRKTEAEQLFRRSLDTEERNFSQDYPRVAYTLTGLAALLLRTNRLGEAEPMFRRALAIREKGLIPDHPLVAISLRNLAKILRETGQPDEAALLHQRASEIEVRNGHVEIAQPRRVRPAPAPPTLEELRAAIDDALHRGHWEAGEMRCRELLAAGEPLPQVAPNWIQCLLNAHTPPMPSDIAKVENVIQRLEAENHRDLAARLRSQLAGKQAPLKSKPWWNPW